MPWITPVTDRSTNSPGNNTVSDWHRQNNNVEYIVKEVLPSLHYFPAHTAAPSVSMEDYPFADILNVIEQNIAAIEASGVPLPDGWEEARTWVAGGTAPTWQDANRWERNMLLIYEMAERIRTRFRPSGTFTAGQSNILPRKVI